MPLPHLPKESSGFRLGGRISPREVCPEEQELPGQPAHAFRRQMPGVFGISQTAAKGFTFIHFFKNFESTVMAQKACIAKFSFDRFRFGNSIEIWDGFFFSSFLKDRGKSFHCDDSDCPFKGGDIQNNGYNRLNCFSCDYDMCDSCAHRRMFILTKFGTNHASAPTTGAVGGITNKAFDVGTHAQDIYKYRVILTSVIPYLLFQITDNCSLCQLEVNMFPVSAHQNNVSRPATESRSHVPLVQEPIYGHAGAISNINQNAQEPIYGTLSRGNEPQSLGIPVAPLQGSNQRLSPHPMVSLRASQLSPNPILSTNQLNLSALSNMGSDPPSYSTYNMNLPVATYVWGLDLF